MDDKEQTNKRHGVGTTGRKAREDMKVKVRPEDREVHLDSRGHSLIKSKRKIDRENKKAFAVMNVAKAQRKVAITVDRQTSRHTFKTVNEASFESPQLVALIGVENSGKSTLMRTLMRHFTGGRKHIIGPVTVVSSKKRRLTIVECPNNLAAMVDIAKVADTVLLMINVKQNLQNEAIELIDIMQTHGTPRVKIVFTHIDDFPKNDKTASSRMKLFTKRLQSEIFAKPFKLTAVKTMRNPGNSEYKIEEVRNLARFIGEKKPLPNAWRESHPFLLVDRIERIESLSNSESDHIRFYGYTRGCNMSTDMKNMHLMGVDDVFVKGITVLNDPCPTPFQESNTKVKRQPLSMKERKAYAPMCGLGGVLKDADGIHIVSQGDVRNQDGDEDDNEDEDVDGDDVVISKSSLIKELSDSDEEFEEPPEKKRLIETDGKDLVKDFDILQSEMNIDTNACNYERYAYDDTYVCPKVSKEYDDKHLKNLCVFGNWGENEDAKTLLKKDDEIKKRKNNRNKEGHVSHNSDDESENCENDGSENCEDDESENCEDDESENCEDDESENCKDDESENCEDDDIENGEDDGSENCEDDVIEDCEDDESDHCEDDGSENYEVESNVSGDDSDKSEMEIDEEITIKDNTVIKHKKDKPITTNDEWTADTDNLTDFQKKKLERDLKTKRQKTIEKKEKRKALFDKAFDEKTGGGVSTAFFDQWKADHEEQDKTNKEAFGHIENEAVHKFAGIKPGTYVSIDIDNIPHNFFKQFDTSRPVILGGLRPGEDACGILTAKFKLHRHFNMAEVIKNYDPMCFSIGWRRIQAFCHFFKEDDNHRKTYLKYSMKKGLFCEVAFKAPVVPVNTGLVMFKDFNANPKFRIVGLGSVHSKNDSVDIMKKFKRKGYPVKIFKNTAMITGMFINALEVEENISACIKTTSGVRGLIKKALHDDNKDSGNFRATFEAPILMADIVFLTSWAKTSMLEGCGVVSDLVDKNFKYLKPWNEFYKENGVTIPTAKPDSLYKKVERPAFNPEPITFSKKVIEKLPFRNRPDQPKPEDRVQNSRPKIILNAKESKQKQLLDNLMDTEKKHKEKMYHDRQKYDAAKAKEAKLLKEKQDKREKEKRQLFFKDRDRNGGKKGGKSKKRN